MKDLVKLGSRTAKNGFRNGNKFINLKNDSETKNGLSTYNHIK